MVDNRDGHFPAADQQLVAFLCNRRLGIGADGLILLQNRTGYDFEMVYFNADGRLGSMCGNGGRCTVAFARQLGVIRDTAFFLAADGDHEATISPQGLVSLKMNDVQGVERIGDDYYLNTGSPHYIRFVDDVQSIDVFKEGRAIRYNDRFAAVGTNVNFVQKTGENEIFVRTYERGVEDETLSCGTGVVAAALAASLRGYSSPTTMKTIGGELSVEFKSGVSRLSSGQVDMFKDIFLAGPAKMVFEGDLEL